MWNRTKRDPLTLAELKTLTEKKPVVTFFVGQDIELKGTAHSVRRKMMGNSEVFLIAISGVDGRRAGQVYSINSKRVRFTR